MHGRLWLHYDHLKLKHTLFWLEAPCQQLCLIPKFICPIFCFMSFLEVYTQCCLYIYQLEWVNENITYLRIPSWRPLLYFNLPCLSHFQLHLPQLIYASWAFWKFVLNAINIHLPARMSVWRKELVPEAYRGFLFCLSTSHARLISNYLRFNLFMLHELFESLYSMLLIYTYLLEWVYNVWKKKTCSRSPSWLPLLSFHLPYPAHFQLPSLQLIYASWAFWKFVLNAINIYLPARMNVQCMKKKPCSRSPSWLPLLSFHLPCPSHFQLPSLQLIYASWAFWKLVLNSINAHLPARMSGWENNLSQKPILASSFVFPPPRPSVFPMEFGVSLLSSLSGLGVSSGFPTSLVSSVFGLGVSSSSILMTFPLSTTSGLGVIGGSVTCDRWKKCKWLDDWFW